MHTIGSKIQEQRQKINLTQEALAEKLAVSRQSVSKWELGQALPEVDKILAMSHLFSITTDELLSAAPPHKSHAHEDLLRLGSIYLIVKDLPASVRFYEKLLSMQVTKRFLMYAEFCFDNQCIALMDESRLPGRDSTGQGSHKFALNFCIKDLPAEHIRVKALKIGNVSEIQHVPPNYYYFQLRDPDSNVIEIAGNIHNIRRNGDVQTAVCQSCGIGITEFEYGTRADGSKTGEYCHGCYRNGQFLR